MTRLKRVEIIRAYVNTLSQRWWPYITALLLTAISILSLAPLPELPEVPGSDKTHHLIAYAALMLPAFSVNAAIKYRLLLAFLFWSGGIELVQPLVNRYGEWADLAANGLGLVTGALLGILVKRVVFEKAERVF